MRILLIEDDKDVVLALRKGLRSTYRIDSAFTGQDGMDLAEDTTYGAILLDLSLPDVDGSLICESVRSQGINTPILVLTGRLDISDKIRLLDMGADDYLTKPFSLEELKARVRAIIRRKSAASQSSKLKVGELSLDTATRKVDREMINIQLRRKEFDLLEYLMLNAGKVVTRSMILDHVWDTNDNLWTNAIDVHIKYLRDKIDRPFSSSLIKTVHGVGYKIEDVKKVLARS